MSIEELKSKINRIDATILSSIEERIKTSLEINKLGNGIFNPTSDFKLLKSLITNSQLPKLFILDIWRRIISLPLAESKQFKIGVQKSLIDNYFIVKNYFGDFVEVEEYEAINTIIQKLQNNEIQVATFDFPNNFNEANWWINLINNQDNLKICSLIENEKNNLLIVAKTNLEKTGCDNTLLSIEMDKHDSIFTIEEILKELNINYKILQKNNIGSANYIDFYLLTIEDFVEENSQFMQDFKNKTANLSNFYVSILGTYSQL